MNKKLYSLVSRYRGAPEAERPRLLAKIRKLSNPEEPDSYGKLPPLMPCQEHGTERVELIDSKSWLFLCHECGELFRNNGDEGLARLLLEDEERVAALRPPICPGCGADRVVLEDAFMSRWHCVACRAEIGWDGLSPPEVLVGKEPLRLLVIDRDGNVKHDIRELWPSVDDPRLVNRSKPERS